MPRILQIWLHSLLAQADSTTHMGKLRHRPCCCSEADPASEPRSTSYACGLFFPLYHESSYFYSMLKSCSFLDLYKSGPSEMVRTGMRGWWWMAHCPCAKVTATCKFTLESSPSPSLTLGRPLHELVLQEREQGRGAPPLPIPLQSLPSV